MISDYRPFYRCIKDLKTFSLLDRKHYHLFIQLYRHNPKISLAFSVIEQLIDMDEHMTNWRSRHAQMALRMLGKKMGSGGSSGEQYLKEAALHHKVFGDFFRLTTFFIEEEKLVHI